MDYSDPAMVNDDTDFLNNLGGFVVPIPAWDQDINRDPMSMPAPQAPALPAMNNVADFLDIPVNDSIPPNLTWDQFINMNPLPAPAPQLPNSTTMKNTAMPTAPIAAVPQHISTAFALPQAPQALEESPIAGREAETIAGANSMNGAEMSNNAATSKKRGSRGPPVAKTGARKPVDVEITRYKHKEVKSKDRRIVKYEHKHYNSSSNGPRDRLFLNYMPEVVHVGWGLPLLMAIAGGVLVWLIGRMF
ncbi:hypothetical protein CALCODRAFT_492679 [Calocera cornea HHB12733]|uniref:Uncharacterized protein n=1 Tax=Calocera cornea HHB12733 TaxID=1353952 RepID=A0A165IAM5_9BASI|nr:hypothetical protein CALCODRAFT_492679 [Calocera cornea HHB12733]